MNTYFNIRDLKCAYKQNDNLAQVVLQVEELTIPQGEVVFIVGQSGCGKSTILETLGLMNNTVLSAEQIDFRPEPGKVIDFSKIWSNNNDVLAEIRKNYYSFIFQHTNLMRNFSIFENAQIPQMIKGGRRKYDDLLKETGLEQILKENKQDVGELSGGQQQRLAFVRAFLPDFKIIFGDEPTGNLDPVNADNLLKLIADEIKNSNGVKTAIIVSHTLELAIKYAHRIIKIHKIIENDSTHGLIDKQSVYEKRDSVWYQSDCELKVDQLQNLIQL